MRYVVVLLALALGGCSAPLKPVSYTQPVAVRSDLRAAVVLVSGAVRGGSGTTLIPAGTIFVPISTGPNPRLQFNTEDQKTFMASFRGELERLKLVRETIDAAPGSTADIGIQIIFAQTFHQPEPQTYVLDVVMEIVGGRTPFLKQYRVVSSEGDSFWQKMNTNAGEAKAAYVTTVKKL